MDYPRHAELWLGPYLRDRLRRHLRPQTKRLWVTITDHFEPSGMGASPSAAMARVESWRERWPRIADDAPRDSCGASPQYTFFYPQEEYSRQLLEVHCADRAHGRC